MSDAVFPIAVTDRQKNEIWLYVSLDELQGSVEEIDVDNDEYSGWDADGFPICIELCCAVRRGNYSTTYDSTGDGPWLRVVRKSAQPAREEFMSLVLKVARCMKVVEEPFPDEPPMWFLERIHNTG